MTNTSILDAFLAYPILPCFILTNIAIGIWTYTRSMRGSFEEYALGSRSLPIVVMAMTWLGPLLHIAALLWYPSNIYRHGLIGFLPYVCSWMAVLGIGMYIAPRLVHFKGCLTVCDVIERMYGPRIRMVCGIITLASCLFILRTQIKGLRTLGMDLLGLSPALSTTVFRWMVILYCLMGGMRAMGYAHVLQVVAAFIALGWVLQTIWYDTGGLAALWEQWPTKETLTTSLSKTSSWWRQVQYTLFRNFLLVGILTPSVVQRMLAVRDQRTATKVGYTCIGVYGIMVMMLALISWVGMVHHKMDISYPKLFLLAFIQTTSRGHVWMLQVVFIGFASFAICTIASHVHAASVTFVQDVVKPIMAQLGQEELTSNHQHAFAIAAVYVIGRLWGLMSLTLPWELLHVALWINYLGIAATYLYGVVVIPLVIGLVGIRTDGRSWCSFALVYAMGGVMAWVVTWYHGHFSSWVYNYFIGSAVAGMVAYGITHRLVHGGRATVDGGKDEKDAREPVGGLDSGLQER